MTASRISPQALAEGVGQRAREIAGKLRRMIVTRASDALWQVFGHTLLEGDEETREAELFQGIGFASRPNATDDVEAIVAFVGEGGAQPIIIATRQEARRIVIADDLEAGETQIHNSVEGANATIIRIYANKTVEIRSVGGTAKRLMTVEDGDALRTAIANAATVANDGGAAFKADILAAWPGPTGTTVLKAE